MDDERSAGALTDAALDAEIARLLTVDPSPQFAARVRARVAEESPRAADVRTWIWAAVAIVLAAIAIVPLVRSTNRVRPLDVLSARSDIRVLPLVDGDVRQLPRATAPRGERSSRQNSPDEPEVLIPTSEMRALREWIRGLQENRLSPAIVNDEALDLESHPIREIVITPLVIEPLAVTAGDEGARQ